jgi:Predicted acyl-CoA transferases/carnitine dehydratase
MNKPVNDTAKPARTRRLPLEGVTVVDFTWGGAGPFATKVLADFGARVIKVETATRLDFPRTTGPYQDGTKGINRSGYFSNRNSSKLGITLNFKVPEALPLALRLIEQADVVVNNFRAGVLDKLGLGYEAVAAIRPDVIYVSMPLQGSTGPQAGHSGIGHTLNAMAGIYALTGYEDGTIVGPGTNFPDHSVNPGHSVVAILAALRHRRRSGEGQYIEVSQLESTITLLGPEILAYSLGGEVPAPCGNTLEGAAPYGAFPCKSGEWCAISIRRDDHWAALTGLAEGCDWATDPAFATAEGRWLSRDALNRALAVWTQGWSADDLMAALQGAGIPAGKVQSARDLIEGDPQTELRGSFGRYAHPEMGLSLYNHAPFHFSGTANGLRSAAPTLGQHNDRVFRDMLGLSDAELADLEQKGTFE